MFLDHVPPGEVASDQTGNQLPALAWRALGGFPSYHCEEVGCPGWGPEITVLR